MASYLGDSDLNSFTDMTGWEISSGLGRTGTAAKIRPGALNQLTGGPNDDTLTITTQADAAPGSTIDGGAGTDTLVSVFAGVIDLTTITLISIERLIGTYALTSAIASNVQYFEGGFVLADAGPFLLSGKTATGNFYLNGTGSVFDATGMLGTGALIVTGTSNGDTIKGGNGNDTLNGGGGDDILFGGAGGNTLTGGAGRDEMHNGLFDILSSSDLVAGEIYDTGNIKLHQVGSQTFDFSTSTLTNISQLYNDNSSSGTALVKLTLAQADQVTFFAGSMLVTLTTGGTLLLAGVNTQSTVTFQLSDQDTVFDSTGSNGPLLHITGGAGNDTITGGGTNLALDIFGGGGNDVLRGAFVMDGGTGADMMYGSAISNTYYADQQGDLVFESANGGVDLIYSTASFYLYDNVEQLTLQGGADLYGVGNALDNQITGNGGGNMLIGGLGVDTLNGMAGIDQLFGGDGNDVLDGGADNDYLAGGDGADTMNGGTGGDSLYGEAGDDTLNGGSDFVFDQLVGGDGNDVLLGNSGLGDYDYLYGNAGDDTFYVDTGDDLTFEQAGEGTDTVIANVAGANNGVYLYANIENLILAGTTAFGVGNELDNVLTGNASGNTLLGGAGADTINGKGGNDILYGQAGADKFVFEHGTGIDNVGDFVAGTDKIDLTAIGFTYTQVQAATTVSGGNTAINLGNGDYVILVGVTAPLSQSDFILAGSGSIHDPVATQTVNISAPEASFSLDNDGLHSGWAPMNATPWFDLVY